MTPPFENGIGCGKPFNIGLDAIDAVYIGRGEIID